MNFSELPQSPTQVGPVLIDWGTLQVVREDARVRITPKAAAVLHLLLLQRDITVSRRRIFDAVWPGSASADEVLTQVVNELRRAFMDNAKDAQFIATIPKLGYRWTGPSPEPVTADTGSVGDAQGRPASNVAATARRWPTKWAATAVAALCIGAALFHLAWRRLPHNALKDTNTLISTAVRPLTAEPGLDLDPAISRDGSRLAYTHVRSERTELRVRTIGTDAYVTVPLPHDGNVSSPAWSPDGTELVFVWRQESRCEIRRVHVDGSMLATLDDRCPSSLPTSVDWSANGDFIVFSRSDAEADALGRRDIAIYRADPDGRNPRRLSHSQRWLSVDLHPRISADSRDIAFIRDADGRHRVVSLAVDGTSTERETPVQLWPYRVVWGKAPGTLLVAGHGRAPEEIQRVDIQSGAATILVSESAGPGLALAPDGNRLIVERRTIYDNIWSVPLENLAATAQRLTDETRSQRCPRISPDGSRLAYLSDEAGNMEIVQRSTASGEHARLSAFAPDVPVDLAWSPRGGFLAVVLGTPRGKRLAVLTADGRRIAIPANVETLDVTLLDWSHDEAWLYLLVADGGRHELRRVHFPDFSSNELIVDQSVGALSAARDRPGIYLVRARDRQLEWLAPNSVAPSRLSITLQSDPADQWLVRDGTLAQMHQIERGGGASLVVSGMAPGSASSILAINAPDPPLGRNFDLGAGRLWYSNRDTDESDLVEVDLSTLQ